ncbi:MAG: HAD family hydrolase [Planctomycetota bacterium]|jgi:HAD superfamily hydrolase (TIGR01549 family)
MIRPDAFSFIKAVVFDMDGTLTVSPLDFDAIRAESGIPEGHAVLEWLEGAPETQRRQAMQVLLRHERRAAADCTLSDGAKEVTEELARRGIKTALLTRNSAESVETVLRRFDLRFDCWISRESAEPKPSPEPVLKIAEQLGLLPEQLLVVGDYVFDVEAGRAAGALTAFVKTAKPIPPPAAADLVLEDLRGLLEVLPGSA